MAFTFTPVGGLGSSGDSRYQITDITLDATGYTTGGFVLTPQQLGFGSAVKFGNATAKTVSANGPAECFLDCSTPSAPKLKMNGAAAEVTAATSLSGAIIEVYAAGY